MNKDDKVVQNVQGLLEKRNSRRTRMKGVVINSIRPRGISKVGSYSVVRVNKAKARAAFNKAHEASAQ